MLVIKRLFMRRCSSFRLIVDGWCLASFKFVVNLKFKKIEDEGGR